MTLSLPIRIGIAALILALLAGIALSMDGYDAKARAVTISLVVGTLLGIVFQRARFCFLCNLRDFHRARDARGVIAILIALAVGLVGYAFVFGAWMPVVQPERLPPTAHIGPVSIALVVSAFVFGVGMSLSGSCLSGHLYRIGEGSLGSIIAIVAAIVGFGLGFLSWNSLYLSGFANGPSVWLPHHLGYGGTLAVSLVVLGALAFLVLRLARPQDEAPLPALPLQRGLEATFLRRWSPAIGGLAVGIIATIAYFRVAPLGVTAEIGSLARTGAANANLLPTTLYGLDAFRGCIAVVKEALVSPNGALVVGLVLGSLASALAANQFKPVLPNARRVVDLAVGGLLMGWGAMVALGCTVGVLLSGIHAGALSGWVFLVACVAGAYAGFWLVERIGAPSARIGLIVRSS